jgi:hypothetical protein
VLHLSIGSHDAFQWRLRLREERHTRNLTDTHVRIGEHLQALVEAGHDQPSHAEIATELKVGPRTVGDALRRMEALGMLGWEKQYIGRRRTVNRYWWSLPASTPIARPELRRRRARGAPAAVRSFSQASFFLPLLPCAAKSAERADFEQKQQARVLAHLAEQRRARIGGGESARIGAF